MQAPGRVPAAAPGGQALVRPPGARPLARVYLPRHAGRSKGRDDGIRLPRMDWPCVSPGGWLGTIAAALCRAAVRRGDLDADGRARGVVGRRGAPVVTVRRQGG